MSTDVISYTFAISSDKRPAHFSSSAELQSFVELNASGRPSDSRRVVRREVDIGSDALVLYGSTRNGWFYYAIDNVIATRGIQSLNFLKDNSFDQRLESEHDSYLTVSFLDPSGLDAPIADIQEIFAWAYAEPNSIAELLPGYEVPSDYSTEERKKFEIHTTEMVHNAIHDDSIYVFPSLDAPYAEDGTGPEYFVAFLRTVQAILKQAKSRGMIVVHFRDIAK